MATMNISLPDPMKAWVEAQTQDGRYANASDYVRDLIRRDQDRKQAIAELQQMVDEALASGPPRPFDLEAFLAQKRGQDASPRV
jgi:antitoxin ParD1/3/4